MEIFESDKSKLLIGVLCISLLVAVIVTGIGFFRAIVSDPAEISEDSETISQVQPETKAPAELPTQTTLPQLETTAIAETVEGTVPAETAAEETVPETTEALIITYDTVPQFFQTDYPEVRYGTGTIANSGCNMTSLAMVASYLTDHTYYPDEMADYTADYIGNHIERLEYGSDLLQLSWKKAGNFHDAVNALKEGKVVIAVMNEKSLFTNGQHFIVLTGLTEDGLILVNDPNENNYSEWNLKDGFENGFREGLILCGFSGAWIYDKNTMPEEPFIYEPVPYAAEPRYPGLELTEEEMDLIADLIWMEAQSEPFEGQQAIAEVILNRLVSGNFQSSVQGIIFAENQFAAADQIYMAEPTYTQYKAIERALYGPYVVPADVVFYAKFAVNDNVWGKIGAHTFCYSY